MRRAWVLLVLAGTAVAQGLDAEKQAPGPRLAAGKTYEWMSPAKRPYLYRVPEAGPRSPHLILIFHGTGMSYLWGIGNYGVHQGHFRPYDFVLSPESEQPARGFVQGKPDRDDAVALIKLFRKTWPEIRNVYIYGHSQGAFFCYYFAGEEPDLIDGIVAHAGNFFKAKFDKAARDRVAIGILHGRADAVVTVQCAFTTDLLYRDAGYRHVRLMVVDGLNADTGHWPLPWHVPRMLAWCDRAAAKGPREAVEAALEELAQEAPDLAAVATARDAATRLLEKASPEEKGGVAERLEAVSALLASARDAFLADPPPAGEAAAANGPWATRFRIARAAFGHDPKWRDAAPLQKEAARHDLAVEQAIKGFLKGSKKAYASALEVVRKSCLGAGYESLVLHLGRWEKPGEEVGEKDLAAFRALEPELKRAREDGEKAARELWAEALKRFVEAHSEWLKPYRPRE
jgi:pimeloyl-ACP methyl ester carboxylesterase